MIDCRKQSVIVSVFRLTRVHVKHSGLTSQTEVTLSGRLNYACVLNQAFMRVLLAARASQGECTHLNKLTVWQSFVPKMTRNSDKMYELPPYTAHHLDLPTYGFLDARPVRIDTKTCLIAS